ncbi:hypothetical protein PPERSA_00661 [Pseudocohnilembus persalinus]|uniref:Saccharopine dehydrogenase n=1 Tax=Pseudocohnilembus persalinus TaxID=266149 RepID=A0A0V0QTM1_PSEPJ|nr:hypothetical protein PPERSA_00661 [Pseudocohnilembus persalinus]|eukprot:KRX05360.1 hypothetical protein PPERSA_00661 [Pseudocohnilembus persalinus]
MSQQKKILLLGSGLMAQTVVDFLSKRSDNFIMIASNILKDAQALANGRKNCSACEVDVTNPNVFLLSYVPWTLHMHIAKACLKEKKNLVTASYIQPAMKELNQDVENAGLTFLNEVGVDPGIDHIATMKVVDECAEKGEKILEYESFCGGLPSPEYCDNPLGYKFSWSPIGALLALKNDAVYLLNGQPKNVGHEDLLYTAQKKDVNMSLSLEGYPNRDSVKYKELYRLNDCQNLIRGTLRFYGFSVILNSMKALGLLDNQNKVTQDGSWFELLGNQVKDVKKIDQTVGKVVASLGLDKQQSELVGKILTKSFANENYKDICERDITEKAQIIVSAYQTLGFFNPSNTVSSKETYLVNLVQILEKSCTLAEGETDMIVMQHKFKILRKDGSINNKKSTMIVIGQKNGFSAMAITVGTPTALAAQLILDGKITRKGVLMPNHKDIYQPLFDELTNLGLMCKEQDSIVPAAKI